MIESRFEMDLKDWCEQLKKNKNIEVKCDDWSAFEIELMKLINKYRGDYVSMMKFAKLFS